MDSREASDLDAKHLEELFKELHFSVQRWDNLTADVRYELMIIFYVDQSNPQIYNRY